MKEQGIPVTTLVAMVGILAFTSAIEAALIIHVNEVGGDVVFATTGSLDLTGATPVLVGTGYGLGLIPGGDNWYIASGSGSSADSYALTIVDVPFGTSTTYFDSPTSSTGDDFFMWGNEGGGIPQVGVPGGYVSGSAISSEMVFASTTFADLTLIPGTYDFAIPNDTITLVIPAPAAALPMLAGGGLLATRRRRRE